MGQITDELTLSKASGKGIKVDIDAPTFGYRDIIGLVLPDPAGTNSPTLTAFRGGSARAYQYASGDKLDCVYHIPHDYVPGSDLYIHLHWGHNNATISGNFVCNIGATYASREGVAPFSIFGTEVAPTITYNTLDITNFPQYCHVVTEIQLSDPSPAATQLDSDIIEVDGLIVLTFTYAGTMSADPFIFTGDIHYQSRNIATKSKDPDYYI